jgi:hypothetical protein
MGPFEALYGIKCRTPLYWSETGERRLFRADIIREAKKVGSGYQGKLEDCLV